MMWVTPWYSTKRLLMIILILIVHNNAKNVKNLKSNLIIYIKKTNNDPG